MKNSKKKKSGKFVKRTKKELCKFRNRALASFHQMENFLIQHRYVSGVTVIELVLILVIIIALLVIFKDNLVKLITDIFEKITSESANF